MYEMTVIGEQAVILHDAVSGRDKVAVGLMAWGAPWIKGQSAEY